jgi:hypothetical protein
MQVRQTATIRLGGRTGSHEGTVTFHKVSSLGGVDLLGDGREEDEIRGCVVRSLGRKVNDVRSSELVANSSLYRKMRGRFANLRESELLEQQSVSPAANSS